MCVNTISVNKIAIKLFEYNEQPMNRNEDTFVYWRLYAVFVQLHSNESLVDFLKKKLKNCSRKKNKKWAKKKDKIQFNANKKTSQIHY